jgi:carbonic anhydrase/acetyltransferase-like protein (isoleucine patch superfamily)
VGHNVVLGSATIADDALIGMGSRVGDRVVVERGACIGAGAWVEHEQILRAISQRNGEAAASLVRAHLQQAAVNVQVAMPKAAGAVV